VSTLSRADILRGYDDFRVYCNRILGLRPELSGEPYRLVAVRDGQLIDHEGKPCDDFLAGWGTQAFGHRNRAIERAIREYLDTDVPSFFTSGVSPYAGIFARRLCERSDGAYGAAFFASSGTEAVESCIKLARAATGRSRILGMEGAFHGCTMGSVAMMAPGDYRDPFAPHLPNVSTVPYDDVNALEKALRANDVAGVVFEPIQVENGLREPSPEYLAAASDLTMKHGSLLIADEVITGMGRTGYFLASERWPRRPDIVAMGKALGGGLMPVSCMLTRRDLFERAYGTHKTAEGHGSTFSGNALACVAGLAALDLLDGALLEQVRTRGDALVLALREALADLDLLVEGVKGRGLLAGIRLKQPDHPWFSFDAMGLSELEGRPATGLMLCHRLSRAGFVVSVGAHDWNTVRIHPALTTSTDRIAAFVHACAEEVRFLCNCM
jgi:acetylornithine/succinyldiaminopimelate/putrescine aminotransferase